MKIRITLERRHHVVWNGREIPASKIVKEFTDPAIAANWFIEDSYFEEPYTVRATWEQVEE